MKRFIFKCTLLTDVIISAMTATDGEHQSLNFIPGSNFLGILAGAVYRNNETKLTDDNFKLFHSGKVRFGDAHLLFNDKRSLQIPFSWYYPKGGSLTTGENYLINFMKHNNFDPLIKEGKQLDQARNGYFTPENDKVGYSIQTSKVYSQKTRHDAVKRKSKESKMFGYEAIESGSEWLFYVDTDNDISDDLTQQLVKNLIGIKRLGRSKTAEFSRVKIELVLNNENNPFDEISPATVEGELIELEKRVVVDNELTYPTEKHNLVLLYAESRLAFRDQYGNATFTPSPEDLGLPKDAIILWDRSQIRTGVYAQWNNKRKSRDEDRVFIEKGSVFVAIVNQEFSNETIIKGVGYYCTEGFGQLAVNPPFLKFYPKNGKLVLQLSETKSLNPDDEKSEEDVSLPVAEKSPTFSDADLDFMAWLRQDSKSDKDIKALVDQFVSENGNLFPDVTKSQWGEVRKIAASSSDQASLITKLFAPGKREGYLTHGGNAYLWTKGLEVFEKTVREIKEEYAMNFTEKLADVMSKKVGNL